MLKFLSFLLLTGTILGTSALNAQTDSTGQITDNEKAEWEHMSIGANFFPYVWFKAINSVSFLDANKKPTNPLYSNIPEMEKRLGLKKSQYREVEVNGIKRQYILPFSGMSVSWTNQDPKNSDAYVGENNLTHDNNGVKSAKMVGINCAFCHQSELNSGDKSHLILGAPSQTNVNGYYMDLIFSTVGMFVNVKDLESFLVRVKAQNPELVNLDPKVSAALIHKQFKKEIGVLVTGSENAFLNNFAYYWTLLSAKKLKDRTSFRKISPALKNAYLSLFRVTHNLKESDDLGEVEDFAEWFSKRAIGDELHVKKTPYMFGRSDALGSYGNAEVRGAEAVDLTAPVSYPWVWGTKYMSFAHYTASFNSSIQRNIGAALAISGTYSLKNKRTSINIASVGHLEEIMQKVAPPQWDKVFKTVSDKKEYQINKNILPEGKNIYEQKCMTCHESNRLVGPQKNLRDYNVYMLKDLGTDPNSAINVVKQVANRPFSVKATQVVSAVQQIFYEKNKVSLEDQAAINKTEMRGTPFLRDTYSGFSNQDEIRLDYGNIVPGGGYKARHLAGAWATGPFLHNNSVPTLLELLAPANERPVAFILDGLMKYDPARVGVVTTRMTGCAEGKDAPAYSYCFDSKLSGNSKGGHEYGTYTFVITETCTNRIFKSSTT